MNCISTAAPLGEISRNDVSPPASSPRRITALCLAVLVATLWLATRPYLGVIHDSRFYTVQALSALLPGRFADDLYFRYGSQDQFTLFSPIYRPFIASLGMARANLILTVLGQCLWITGAISLARGLVGGGKVALVAVAIAVALPGNSGPFGYGEPFLTPRLFSEALTLLAMGLMLRGRPARALLVLGISVTIHPLMTIPGFAVLFWYESARYRAAWVVGFLAVLTLLGLAFWGVQPFVRLLESFDPAWLSIVQVRDGFCFISQWDASEWLPVCTTLSLAAFGLLVAESRERRFLVAVLAVASAGLAVSLIGGDVLRNVLVLDIQLWRAMWLLAVVVHLLVGAILLRSLQGSSSPTNAVFLFLLAIGLLVLSSFMRSIYLLAMPTALAACLVGTWGHVRKRTIPTTARILVLVFVGTVLGMTVLAVRLSLVSLAASPTAFWGSMRGITLTVVALGAIAVLATDRAPARKLATHPILMLCLALASAAVAVWGWDQRLPWTKFVDTTDTPPASLVALLPDHSPIYWEDDVTVPWFLLKRPSYFSCEQGTGVLFSRGTAITYQRRFESFQPLRTLDFGRDSSCPTAEVHRSAPLSRDDLSAICKREPELGALVLTRAVTDAPGHVWIAPVEFQDVRIVDGKLRPFATDRFFVYSCADLR